MKKAICALVIMLVCLASAFCAGAKEKTDEIQTVANGNPVTITMPESPVEQYYFAMGYYEAYSNLGYYDDFNAKAFADGAAAFASGTFAISDAKLSEIVSNYSIYLASKDAEIAAVNREKATAFLAENAGQEGVVITESGLQYKANTVGTGERPEITDTVEVNYKLSLVDGTVVESTYDYGQTAVFPLGNVIPGFAEGLMNMTEGSTYTLWINADLGYGDYSTSAIPAGSLLIFDVELVSIVK